MSKTDTDKTGSRLEEIRRELRVSMLEAGIKTEPYDISIEIAAQTLLEREKAYEEYISDESGQMTERALRLMSWNEQAIECLTMLKLTPTRFDYHDQDEEG